MRSRARRNTSVVCRSNGPNEYRVLSFSVTISYMYRGRQGHVYICPSGRGGRHLLAPITRHKARSIGDTATWAVARYVTSNCTQRGDKKEGKNGEQKPQTCMIESNMHRRDYLALRLACQLVSSLPRHESHSKSSL